MARADEKSSAWLDNAYALETPEDNRCYYRDFAGAYDQEFADALGYCYPRIIAEAYRTAARPEDQPIADIGCGTGLVAEALPDGNSVDGFDISPEMLDMAAAKSVYRDLKEIDITGDLSNLRGRYGAVVSAGTFTHGHLGPEPLRNLLAIARDRGLFVIGINKAHFHEMHFDETLASMTQDALISKPVLTEAPIYDATGHEHEADRALVLTYRKRELV